MRKCLFPSCVDLWFCCEIYFFIFWIWAGHAQSSMIRSFQDLQQVKVFLLRVSRLHLESTWFEASFAHQLTEQHGVLSSQWNPTQTTNQHCLSQFRKSLGAHSMYHSSLATTTQSLYFTQVYHWVNFSSRTWIFWPRRPCQSWRVCFQEIDTPSCPSWPAR